LTGKTGIGAAAGEGPVAYLWIRSGAIVISADVGIRASSFAFASSGHTTIDCFTTEVCLSSEHVITAGGSLTATTTSRTFANTPWDGPINFTGLYRGSSEQEPFLNGSYLHIAGFANGPIGNVTITGNRFERSISVPAGVKGVIVSVPDLGKYNVRGSWGPWCDEGGAEFFTVGEGDTYFEVIYACNAPSVTPDGISPLKRIVIIAVAGAGLLTIVIIIVVCVYKRFRPPPPMVTSYLDSLRKEQVISYTRSPRDDDDE
jgi:hypothetical protein